MLKEHARTTLLQKRKRRLDERRAQAVAREQRPAGGAAGGERFADHRTGKLAPSHAADRY